MLCWLLQGQEFKSNVTIEFGLESKGPFEWSWCHSSQFSTCLKHSRWRTSPSWSSRQWTNGKCWK
jgi:hypothetical protein